MSEIDWRARAEAAEAERDALAARIAAVLAACKEVTDVPAWQRPDTYDFAVKIRVAVAAAEKTVEEPYDWPGKEQVRAAVAAYRQRLGLPPLTQDPFHPDNPNIVRPQPSTVPAPGGSDVNEILAASRAAAVEPVEEPPRRKVGEAFVGLDGASQYLDPGPPLDPQPPTCATCGGTGIYCSVEDSSIGPIGLYSPCPSCVPTEPGDAT